MRRYLIEKTEREGLTYSVVMLLKYQTAKLLNVGNFLLRRYRISRYMQTHPLARVHFGAGSGNFGEADITALDGFLNTDILGNIPVDITGRLPFADGTVDTIFSNHLVEHLYHRQFKNYLRETFRVLKKGGRQIIATPSLEKLCLALYSDDAETRALIYRTHLGKITGNPLTPAMVINGMTHINYGHKFLYDYETLRILGTQAGYASVRGVAYDEIPDQEIAGFLRQKDPGFHAETEVFLLTKA